MRAGFSIACLLALSSFSLAQDLDPSTCIAPAEYETCNRNAQAELEKCQAVGDRSIRPCTCKNQAAVLNCVGRYCWNKVYGCEYQCLVEKMHLACVPSSQESRPPFWPMPENAPGACSCDTSNVYLEPTNTWNTGYSKCIDGLWAIEDTSDPRLTLSTNMCLCCYVGFVRTSLIQSCPTYDFPRYRYDEEGQAAWHRDCDRGFEKFNCSVFGYNSTLEIPSVSLWPEPGTLTSSNLPGEVMSPASGYVYTWSYTWTDDDRNTKGNMTYTVTAMSVSGIDMGSSTLAGTSSSSSTAQPGSVGKARREPSHRDHLERDLSQLQAVRPVHPKVTR
ncbi:hypothetical protein DL98DRAFT_595035 [Cadophora sp. DSE1049]|nr:hypothetical protein DL98DRAFT_595035 [Cadophora sp. DSE1049]